LDLFNSSIASDIKASLIKHPENPHRLMNSMGEAVFLAGAHTWANRQERGIEGQTPDFDYGGYLDFLEKYNHNFLRLWVSGRSNSRC